MAIEKILNTRIQLKYDSYTNWTSVNPMLNSGEVAIAYLTTAGAVTPETGDTQHPVMFKVGPGNFNDLPWASALAADVHTWAKKSESEFKAWVKQFIEVGDINTFSKEEINSKLSANSTADQNYAKGLVDGLNVTDSAVSGKYVSAVSESKGKITVTRANLPTYTLATGSANGTVAFNGTDVAVKGLNTAAYKAESYFDKAGTGAAAAATAKSEAIADAASKYATIKAAQDAQKAADNANQKIDAFMSSDAKVEGAIDTLVEIAQYINTDTQAFTGLSNRVGALEDGTKAAKVASSLDSAGETQVKGIKVNNATNADKLGNVAAADYLKKSEAAGYNDILTKTAAASQYQAKGNYASSAQGAKADTAIQSVTTGEGLVATKNGTTVNIDFDTEVVFVFNCGGASDVASPTNYSMRVTTPVVSAGSDGVFEPNGDASNFTGIEINGQTVPSSYYTVS